MTVTGLQDDPRLADRPHSIARMFLDRVEASPDKEAFRSPDGERWTSITWRETADRVKNLAAGLLSLGITSENRVAIASSTRVDWILADLAIMCAGAATTTVYPSTSHEDVGFILSDSGSRVVFAEDADQVEKVRAHRGELPNVEHVVVFDGKGDGDWVMTLGDLETKGREFLKRYPDAVEQAVAAIKPEDLATLIYTSGTTGRPKGVRLVQDCWVYEGVAIDTLGILREDDLQYLWLPLSHSFGKVLQAAQLAVGFSSAVDGRVDKLDRQPGRRQADLHGRRAAHLREGAQPHRAHGCRRRRREGEDLQLGDSGWASRSPSSARRARSRPGCSNCSTVWRTSSCSARSSTVSAAGCATSCPAPLR